MSSELPVGAGAAGAAGVVAAAGADGVVAELVMEVGIARVAGGICRRRPGMIKLVTSSEFALSSAPRLTPLRHAMLASASPATTTYSVPDPAGAADEVEATAAGRPAGSLVICAPAGITRVWPGWMTLVSSSELARSNADRRTPWRHARPARLSPSRTVIVVSTVVVVPDVELPVGAAEATPPNSGRATAMATPAARMIRAVRVMPSPSARQPSTFTFS